MLLAELASAREAEAALSAQLVTERRERHRVANQRMADGILLDLRVHMIDARYTEHELVALAEFSLWVHGLIARGAHLDGTWKAVRDAQ
jgi:hypothetical protein